MLLRICITHNDQFSFDQPAIKKNRKKLEQVSLSLSLFFVIVTHKLIDSIPDPITDLDHVDKFGGDTEKVNFVKANRNRRNGVTRSVTHSSRFFDTRVPSHDIRLSSHPTRFLFQPRHRSRILRKRSRAHVAVVSIRRSSSPLTIFRRWIGTRVTRKWTN